jgi:hypothetical protein
MDILFKKFTDEVENYINLMNEQELREWILNVARQTTPEKRKDFLENFKREDKQSKSKNDAILKLCNDINSGKIILEYEYEDYSDESACTDDKGIGNKLLEAFNEAEKNLYLKNYKDALNLYENLCNLNIQAIELSSEENYEVDINELVDTDILNVDLKKISSNYIYCKYMMTDNKNRPKEIYISFCDASYKIKLEDVMRVGPEKLPDLDEFLGELIIFLKKQDGVVASKLLREAVIYTEGSKGLSRIADELYDKFPECYVDLCNMLYEDKNDDKVIKSALRGIEKINKNLIIRADVAEIMIKCAECANNKEMTFKGIQVAFESDVNVNNFLRLFKIPNNNKILKQAIERAEEVLRKPNPIHNYRERQYRETSLTEHCYNLIRLFNFDFDYIYEICLKDKKSVGWSSSLKGTVVPIFMILLVKKNTSSKLMDKEILMFIHNINYYNKDLCENFIHNFKQWMNNVKLTDEEHSKYLEWCVNEVDKRVRDIVSNQYRGAYNKAALLIVSLAEIYEFLKENSGIAIIKKYRAMFPRHRAFLAEIDAIKKL